MNAKKTSIIILSIIFILFSAVCATIYNNSDNVGILCYDRSYAQEYAEKHNIDYELIPDSNAYIGVLSLDNFDYNNDGSIVSYNGSSEIIAIPANINGITITTVKENAFENANNITSIYLPKTIVSFEAKLSENITVYMYEDTDIYKQLSKKENINFTIKTIPDSYFVDFYSANIPFAYNYISDKSLDITHYLGQNNIVIVPERIDGKIVTSISFEALDNGVDVVVIPKSITRINTDLFATRYDIKFLIGIIIAFIGTGISLIAVATLKSDNKKQTFLRIPQFRIAYTATILSLIISAVYLFVKIKPEWILYVAVILIYGLTLLSIIKAKSAALIAEGVGDRVTVKTSFIRSLTADSEVLMNTSSNTEVCALTKKVYESIRYCDPMSNAVLVEVEEKIQNAFEDFKEAIESQDFELALANANELLSLIETRNKKCKLLK